MKVQAKSLIRLLWPHARPYRWALVGVFLLGWLTALLGQSVIVLVAPTWEVMFAEDGGVAEPAPTLDVGDGPAREPAEESAEESAEKPAGTGGLLGWAEERVEAAKAWFGAAKERAKRSVLGADPSELTPDERMGVLYRVTGIIAVIALLAGAAGYAFNILARRVALLMIMGLRLEVANHLMSLSLRYHSRRRFGDLLSRISGDVSKAMTIANTMLKDLVQQPLNALMALAVAFVLAPEATLFVAVGLPIMLWPVAKLLKQIRRRSTKSLGKMGASVQVLAQMFSGMRTVKAFRAEKRELERYRAMQESFIQMTMRMERASALSKAWTLVFSHMGIAVVLLVLGWLAVRRGAVGDSGEMAVFFLMISRVYSGVKVTTRAWSKVAEAMGACDRLNQLFEEKPDIVERPDARPCTGLGSGLRIEGVRFSYPGGGATAIDGIDLDVRPGETLALVGPSGAGKTTLVDLVARFVDPTEGRVLVDGVDLRDMTMDSWSATFAMVTQEPFLFHATIAENLRYGKFDATDEELVAAARAANIHEFIESLPKGYDTNVADAGTRLSGGQRQRLTIARAVLHGGELLLLDEATSALDTESEAVVQAALDGLMVDRTVIVIAHRLSTVRNADRIAVMDAGRIVELGTHEELIAKGGLYARLYAMQFAE